MDENAKDLREFLHKAYVESAKKAIDEYFEFYFTPIVKRYFGEAVSKFYSYKPKYYRRQKRLGTILNIGREDNVLQFSFDETKLPYRNELVGREDGLYNLVFIEGWHGGAYSGDYTVLPGRTIYTPRPQRGTPYWRNAKDSFRSWGRMAERDDVSPYDNMMQHIIRYWNTKAQNQVQNLFDKYMNQYRIKL